MTNDLVQTITNKKSSHKIFVAGMSVFAGMFFLRDVMSVNVPPLLFMVFPCVLMLFFSSDEIVAYVACSPLWHSAFQINYTLLVALVFFLLKNYKQIAFKPTFIVFLFAILWELLHIFVPPFSFTEYVRFAVSYLLVGLLICSNGVDVDARFVIKSFLAILLFALFDVLCRSLVLVGFSFQKLIGYRFGNPNWISESSGNIIYFNQNFLGMLCAVAVALVFLLSKDKKNKVSSFVLVALFVLFALMTQSRTAVVLFAVLLLLFNVWFFKKFNSKGFALVVGEIAVCCLFIFLFPNVLSNVVGRFFVEDISGGRNYLFKQYSALFASNVTVTLFGLGLQELELKSGIINVSHNGLQESLVCWGALGLLMAIAFFIIAATPRNGQKKPLLNYLPLIVLFVYIQAGQFFRLTPTVTMLVICNIAVNYEQATSPPAN